MNMTLPGAVIGLVTAMKVDYNAFAAWKQDGKNKEEPIAVKFDWKLAMWRWFMGTVIGGGIGFAGDQMPGVSQFLGGSQ